MTKSENKPKTDENVEDPLAPSELQEEVSAPEADNVALLKGEAEKIAQLEEELAKSKDQTLRALAELENVRKRSAKEREDASAYGVSRFARDLLSVADNLRRALDAVEEDIKELDPRIPNLLTGIEATEREMLKVFTQNGIEKIEPLEAKFDPNFHEVMFEAPMPDKPNGTVIQVVEPGYVLKGRLLRAAKVGVAKNVDEPPKRKDGHIVNEEA